MRAIGRWSMAALTVNCIIGSGVFGLPAVLALKVGRASVLAVVLGGAAAGVIMACFAEVSSRFKETGGPYLYARAAFGRFMGIQVGLAGLVRAADRVRCECQLVRGLRGRILAARHPNRFRR